MPSFSHSKIESYETCPVVFGSENKISIKEYEYVRFPGKNTKEREELIEVLRSIGKLNEVSDLDIYAIGSVLKENEWDEREMDLLRKFEVKEKSCRLSVSKK